MLGVGARRRLPTNPRGRRRGSGRRRRRSCASEAAARATRRRRWYRRTCRSSRCPFPSRDRRVGARPQERARRRGACSTSVPNSGRKRSSSGWATTATHAASSSGRVVSIIRSPPPLTLAEPERVVRAGALTVLELCLRDRGAVVDVPQRRRVGAVRLAAREVAQERALARAARLRADGRVRERPVDREPEAPPQLLERLLVLGDEPRAQLEEVRPRDRDRVVRRLRRRLELGLVREVRFAADPVVVLHAPFGRQPVVVPAHRVEDARGPACAGSERSRRSARSRTPSPCGGIR